MPGRFYLYVVVDDGGLFPIYVLVGSTRFYLVMLLKKLWYRLKYRRPIVVLKIKL